MSTLREMAGSAVDLGQDVKDSVEEFTRTAGRKIAVARDTTGSALHSAASSVRESSAAIEGAGRNAAGRLDATAKFVEDFTTPKISAKLRQFGRNNVTAFVVAGLAVGFLVGSALSRWGRPQA
jgi:hypothetical protein